MSIEAELAKEIKWAALYKVNEIDTFEEFSLVAP
jgi:hypothetical protein